MRRVPVFLIILISANVYSDIPGRWVIDSKLTLDFYSAHSKITDLEKELISCLSSNSWLDISNSYFSFSIKDYSCSFGERISRISDFEERYKYKKIFENNNVVVIASEEKELNHSLNVIHKLNENLIWIYYPGDAPEYNTHLRYYYMRINENNFKQD